MDNNKIKDIIYIKVDGTKIPCYILESELRLISKKISKFFNVNAKNKIKEIELVDKENKKIGAYLIHEAIDNLTPSVMKRLILIYIVEWIEKGGIVEKRKLSEFDKLILEAMKYNPKEKEE